MIFVIYPINLTERGDNISLGDLLNSNCKRRGPKWHARNNSGTKNVNKPFPIRFCFVFCLHVKSAPTFPLSKPSLSIPRSHHRNCDPYAKTLTEKPCRFFSTTTMADAEVAERLISDIGKQLAARKTCPNKDLLVKLLRVS